MEANETSFSSYYHQHHQLNNHHHNPTTATVTNAVTSTAATSPTNGLLPPNSQLGYPSSTTTTTATPETVRRKRGRPRKYETPEEASAARKAALAAAASVAAEGSFAAKKRDQSTTYGVLKKPNVATIGEAGRDFTPHLINVAAGEDVAQKIMLFMQQSKREICILSASGSISNASLRQPATSGGITYEGWFEITSLSGSYIRTDNGGRTGGLSICLSSTDGQIVGGGVGGPLKAATPVQVVVGTFLIDAKRDINATLTGDPYTNQSTSHADGLPISFRSPVDSTGRIPIRGNEDQTMGTHFIVQPRSIHTTPSPQTDWTSSQDS